MDHLSTASGAAPRRRVLAALMLTIAGLLGLQAVQVPASAAVATDVSFTTITSHDGTRLGAIVVKPSGTTGRLPLIVMPSSWGVNKFEYLVPAFKAAAERGYVVVSFTSRGFYESGGEIDVQGDPTVRDTSSVIDWALANTPADPSAIGAAGISYGAGNSLLAAAADPRIKAVSALSGWADLQESFYPGDTMADRALWVLAALAEITGTPGQLVDDAYDAYQTNDISKVIAAAPSRSPIMVTNQLNANGTAVFIGSGWRDSFFQPGQMVDLYNKLTGPKFLELAPGDHATAELAGLAGLDNMAWSDTMRWFDHHLKGVANGINTEKPVKVKYQGSATWRSYTSWATVEATTTKLYLTEPAFNFGDWRVNGGLAASHAGNYSRMIRTGYETNISSGEPLLFGFLTSYIDLPTTNIWDTNRDDAMVWFGKDYASDTVLSGSPRVHTTVTPTDDEFTLIAFVYDVNGGTDTHARMLTHRPITIRNATPGVARTIDFKLNPVVTRIPAGHRLGIVIVTQDNPRYRDASASGHYLTFSSPTGNPSYVTVPTS